MLLHCAQNSWVEQNHFKTMHLLTFVLQVVKTWVLSNLSFSCFKVGGIPAAARWTSQSALSMMWLLTSSTNLPFSLVSDTFVVHQSHPWKNCRRNLGERRSLHKPVTIIFFVKMGPGQLFLQTHWLWSQPGFEACRLSVTFQRFLIWSDSSKYSFLTCPSRKGLPPLNTLDQLNIIHKSMS